VKRCKKSPSPAPAYPHIRAFVRRYRRRVGTGLVVGVVATTAGCDWLTGGVLTPKHEDDSGYEIDGMIAETAETWTLALPEDAPRDLTFADPYGWIRYQLALTIDGTAFYDWLRENAEVALAAVDAVLLAEPVTTYEHDDGFDHVENAIAQALTQAYEDATGGARGHLLAVELAILAYEDEDDILGDTKAAR
jgi:hypothetical protein